ncbi:hypothetical protein [Mesorhizobium jarvisii]|uniref:hypothetical protein n=1 Tax=Mesorhizobium jarvisii TaxID=1777867 RepID=UPI001F0B03EA|nr:hypothetical protein [Mesorhizobium jarvisii]MCH4560733.1 hypothetical protein [Mesorhizobium jarvisii]
MTGRDLHFRRIVLDLSGSGRNAQTAQFVAELAELLDVDLLGRFVEDSDIAKLAGLPFAREFRFLERDWHSLAQEDIMHASAIAVAAARRMFERATSSSTARHHFQVVRHAASAKMRRCDEQIAVIHPQARPEEPFESMLEAAFRIAAGVLIMPTKIVRRSGPVIAVAAVRDDPIVGLAQHLATSAGERLLRLNWPSGISPPTHKRELLSNGGQAAPRRWNSAMATSGTSGFPFGAPSERIVLVSRGTFDDATLSAIASLRRTPVFVVELDRDDAPL